MLKVLHCPSKTLLILYIYVIPNGKNGKLLPLWVLNNFNKYILPKTVIEPNKDLCDNKKSVYQKFVGEYVHYNSSFKSILYHGMGSSKTVTALNVYNALLNYTPNRNAFMILPASLHSDPWLNDMKNWIKKRRLSNNA